MRFYTKHTLTEGLFPEPMVLSCAFKLKQKTKEIKHKITVNVCLV